MSKQKSTLVTCPECGCEYDSTNYEITYKKRTASWCPNCQQKEIPNARLALRERYEYITDREIYIFLMGYYAGIMKV